MNSPVFTGVFPLIAIMIPLITAGNEVCEGYVFTPVCQSFCSQGGMPAPRGVPAPRGSACYWRGVCSRSGCGDTPPPEMATAVGCTHPTGMPSCFVDSVLYSFGPFGLILVINLA